METKPSLGRPRKDGPSEIYSGALYQLLVAKLPSEHINFGRIDTASLAKGTGNARFTLYRWFESNSLSKAAIRSLLEVSKNAKLAKERGKLTRDDLIPFIGI